MIVEMKGDAGGSTMLVMVPETGIEPVRAWWARGILSPNPVRRPSDYIPPYR
jgi:hypothetical protein